MSQAETLKQWAYHYIQSKDAIFKKIKSIEDTEYGYLIKYQDSDKKVLIKPVLDMSNDADSNIYTYNTMDNFYFLLSNWDYFVNLKAQICFVNPNSFLEKKWLVNPYVHDRICERSALKRGLTSLFQTVDIYKPKP
ncbi:MAG: hypothetical protein KJ601_06825 [Nanoarchaeota archaeon]|nr:hypothetical protein [Nanoarchaeota archaeon]MBU1703888.1 hypothetical protein [Nanoarchaeota archaeon]